MRYKRLERGRFIWPSAVDGALRLTAAQLSALLEGLPWARAEPRSDVRPSATQ